MNAQMLIINVDIKRFVNFSLNIFAVRANSFQFDRAVDSKIHSQTVTTK